MTATLATDRGVFSAGQVDTGSRLLLISGPPPVVGDRVIVDVGAGYGPIAVTLAKKNPGATIWAVEVNPRARQLCERNAIALGLTNVRVVTPEEFPENLTVDRIWSNPPIRIGKAPLRELLSSWLTRLAPAGSAHLVVQKNLGADSLAKWLIAEGYGVERRAAQKGFRILDVKPKAEL
ncbi:MAG: methyltransferase [Acidimicrobiales bacterium]|nr:methyltransferase [Acidimicrobiales bacterium]